MDLAEVAAVLAVAAVLEKDKSFAFQNIDLRLCSKKFKVFYWENLCRKILLKL